MRFWHEQVTCQIVAIVSRHFNRQPTIPASAARSFSAADAGNCCPPAAARSHHSKPLLQPAPPCMCRRRRRHLGKSRTTPHHQPPLGESRAAPHCATASGEPCRTARRLRFAAASGIWVLGTGHSCRFLWIQLGETSVRLTALATGLRPVKQHVAAFDVKITSTAVH
jgi:hypothetical protein